MTIQEINELNKESVKAELLKCCGSTTWVTRMAEKHPFTSENELFNIAEQTWHECSNEDWLEAFSHHPKLGDLGSLKKKFANTSEWAGEEQSGANSATPEIIEELAVANKAYEEKFGFIYILCATGKTAKTMLSILRVRLNNDRETELKMAMVEQNKITVLRLEKLLS
ncbi:MAG: OHCU decarboxylase [Bacteroidetes bacterium]|nr:MAG: OHCU decarboxylase [Bacteroidota bacterium]